MVSMRNSLRNCALVAMAMLVAACGSESTVQVAGPAPTPTTKPAGPPAPWERTEERATCDNFTVTRAPYFGDTHVHTTHSLDAVVFNVLGTPQQAYDFAKGKEIRLAPYDKNGDGTRPLKLRRPLDFAAVTDHSEGFGVYQVCFDPSYEGWNSDDCVQVRKASVSADPQQIQYVFINILRPTVINPTPEYPESTCGAPPADCLEGASVIWQEAQETAEQFYDRTADCKFTSFVGYEWTGNSAQTGRPDLGLPVLATGANLHRNVIFRNAVVPELPVSYIEQPKPQNMWQALREQCQEGKPPCDWLAIPHNSNMSGGYMFLPENADGSPLTAADARTRAASEPLVEIYQDKGSSECRLGAGTTDEQCSFELVNRVGIFQNQRDPNATYPPSAYVRDALKVGLLKEQELGANPFQFGVIASTDTHNGNPGATVEQDFQGSSGLNDDTPERRLLLGGAPPPSPLQPCNPDDPNYATCGRSRADDGPGGLAVVWAEENSRDALFSGMRRRETYATSGTRPTLRFFAGNYAENACDDPEWVATGYRQGLPMGAEIGPFVVTDNVIQSPTFAVLAVKDAGEPAVTMGGVNYPAIPGTPLQRVQIVKGWVDSTGKAQEQVFDVAGNATNGAGVNLATCEPTGTGFNTLCTAWTDPTFDATQRAFYYARVLENPTCRWSQMQCNEAKVDCSKPETYEPALVACCAKNDDGTYKVPKTHQERAWSSPIWYRPEGMGAVDGTISFGSSAGKDQLQLAVPLGAGVPHDLSTEDLTVVVRDNDVIYQVTLPKGTVKDGVYEDDAGSIGGVKTVTFAQTGSGPATLTLETVPTDLSKADRLEHMVEVEVRIGEYTAAQTRLWTLSGDTLALAELS